MLCVSCLDSTLKRVDVPAQCPVDGCEEKVSMEMLQDLHQDVEEKIGSTIATYRHKVWNATLICLAENNLSDTSDLEESTRTYIRETTIPCPSCLVPTTHARHDGCHHITCTCGHEWCYCCTRNWEDCRDCPQYCSKHCRYCLE